MPSNLPELKGVRLVLRRPRPGDVEERLALGRTREIVEAYGGTFDPDAPFTRRQAQAAIRFIEEQDHAWVIDAGRYVGHIRLQGLDPHDRRASLAIGIEDPALLGRGYGTEAVRLALGWAFGEAGLHRLSARVLETNVRAIACYRKCGFREEGREREAALVGGRREDDIIMGLLAREFCKGGSNPL